MAVSNINAGRFSGGLLNSDGSVNREAYLRALSVQAWLRGEPEPRASHGTAGVFRLAREGDHD